MSHVRMFGVAVAVLALVLGCEEPSPPGDLDARVEGGVDAEVPIDAADGAMDAGHDADSLDADLDASEPDDAHMDADVMHDASAMDAASMHDASVVDANVVMDSAIVDAGGDAAADGAYDATSVDANTDAGGGEVCAAQTNWIQGAGYRYVVGSTVFEQPNDSDWNIVTHELGVDNATSMQLPFGFTYFGTTYPAGSDLYISGNGTAFFGSGDSSGDNTVLPRSSGAPGVIAAFWNQFDLRGFGVSTYATSNTVGVRWGGVRPTDYQSSVVADLILFRNSNAIQFRYYRNPAGFSATAGIEAPDGETAIQLPCSPTCGPGIVPGTFVTFMPDGVVVPEADLDPSCSTLFAPSPLYPNEAITVTPRVTNLGVLSSTANIHVVRTQAPYFDTDGDFWDIATSDAYVDDNGNVDLWVMSDQTRTFDPLNVFLSAAPSSFTAPGTYRVGLWVSSDTELFSYNDLTVLGDVTVVPFVGDIAITTTSLPAAEVGVPYSVQLAANGSPSPVWTSTMLPPGLTLSASGLLSGTPTQQGNRSVTLTAAQRSYRPDWIPLLLSVAP